MDKRSWPWKKKSSDKQAAEKAAAAATDSSTAVSDNSAAQVKQDTNKKPKYVQISMESYTHLTGLEEQVKSYEEQVKTLVDEIQDLNGKLSEADAEMVNKEILVKQHAKVAEEAVSGWEKAEAEAAALKNHLESVTLLKLTAEDQASHLDGALKECMRQIRNLKEEHEQKLQEVIVNKSKLFDKMKLELEANISNLDQELMRSAAESAAFSRSLQERSNMLVQLSQEKSQAEAEIERLKSNIESYEKEVNSLKYELHIASKEVEIRNEERNMSVRSAEVANKQHLEGVKKIAKLEAECQRLRGLVRKKLPGPAALAQMKLEVENLGRDYGESRLRRSPVKPPLHLPEYSLDNAHKYLKDNELLTERLLAMEEETKMLKEALTKRNSELQVSRSICAEATSKLQSLESQLQANGEEKHLVASSILSQTKFCGKEASNLSSVISISEDANDDNTSCTGSWSTGLMSEVSRFKKENNIDSPHKSENTYHLDLMDDFLEMEKLAHLSNGSNSTVPREGLSCSTENLGSELIENEGSVAVTVSTETQSGDQHGSEPHGSPNEDLAMVNPQPHADPLMFVKLQSKVSLVLESISNGEDTGKVTEEIKSVMQDIHNTLRHQSLVEVKDDRCGQTDNLKTLAEGAEIADTKEVSLSADAQPCINTVRTISQDIETAISQIETALSQIYDFIMIFGQEAKNVPETTPDGDGLNKKLNLFSAKYSGAINSNTNVIEFVFDISDILSKASDLQLNILGFKSSEVETDSSDCIDKIALPENKAVVDTFGEKYPNGSTHYSDSVSDPDVPNDGNLVPTSESTATSWKCSLEEFEQLKTDKDNLAADLARCRESFESTKAQLLETEQVLAEVKSQLTSSQKSNSLADTQLKCMAESYNSLETRAEELQKEVNLLQGKIENLENDLQEEKRNHQESLKRCFDLQVQLERINHCAEADDDDKAKQEKELAAAAEKLSECQETIFLLGKQLNALRPAQTGTVSSPDHRSHQKVEEDVPTISGLNLEDNDPFGTSSHLHRAGSESPMHYSNPPFSPESDANNFLRSPVNPKQHHYTKSGSGTSSTHSTPTPEKQARGFTRFFSSKNKDGQ